ncbi:glutaminase GtaA [Dothidotthia symphoricarpi CBS 119687]|uniref:Glutaminase GtaA n=1 Tax=Dothidotthia symphoricarpi CBS 119687 TaxID=1392245 RepID=A0A6A6A3Q4_9PLEO|nr:glutaminase GtaA [Dothidotthia symphoricarpi CBS 119687]KAF2126519.1 glutaminase GtaA [Dothidotthia symphoricarpi CBS 119687]
MYLSVLSTLGGLLLTTAAESTFTPARPPSLPLAVKNPYLSTWLPAGSDGGNGGYLPGQWPQFWTGQWLGWTGLIRVDGKTFTWMGTPNDIDVASQVAYEYTSTRSIFTIEADDKVTVKITFLSPLTPNDFKRQSLIFSYMEVEVSSLNGTTHDVQIYTDISAEWVSGNTSATAQWESGVADDLTYHKVWKQNQQLFSESSDRAEWGNFYYATDLNDTVTSQSGADVDVRGAFVDSGKLDNSTDGDFRAINDKWPVFGYAVDFGSVGTVPVSQLFTIGLCQDEAIQFLGADGLTTLPSLWKDYFDDDTAALSFFHKDYSESSKLSMQLDDQIWNDSVAAAGENYAILTSLAARQAFAATQLVGTQDKHYLFLKEISSNGNTQTVDVIYPASPIFFYTNPELIKLLLDPHFENQESGHYPNRYAIHDLGAHYPNATGHPDGNDEQMPLEECGNHMIMVLAYVQRSGNTDYIKQHYPILKQWVEYLVEDSLLPAEQLSTDDFAGHLVNQTNLALKGIIGLEAMSQMSKLIGEDADAQNYTTIAHDYITKWEDLGINKADDPPHAMLNYNNASTHGLLYNLYNDKLVNTDLVPQEIYDMQSAFYPTVKENYGVPLDTRNRYYTKADWEIFCAAVASEDTRNMFISDLVRWINETPTSKPLTDLFETSDGRYPGGVEFKARPVMGGMFALLALQGYTNAI